MVTLLAGTESSVCGTTGVGEDWATAGATLA
jgi:hypothetical protein